MPNEASLFGLIRSLAAAALFFSAFTALAVPNIPTPNYGPTDLECENLVHPLGIDKPVPRFSWKLIDPRKKASQTAYEIEVASSPSLLASGKIDVWDTGRIASNQSLDIPYRGPSLQPEMRYYWRVRSWDAQGKPYPEHPFSWFETGVHGDWSLARWIGYEDLEHRTIRSARPGWITNVADPSDNISSTTHHNFRLTFSLSASVKRATLYATGEDTTGAWINGRPVLETTPKPKWGKNPWHTYSQANVLTSLHSGSNVLAIDVLHYEGRHHTQTPMSAELYLEMPDGSTKVISTDTQGWKATLNAPGSWFDFRFDDTTWPSAVGYAGPAGNPLPTGPVVALRREFVTTKTVRSARLYATALGAYKFHINGQAVGAQVLSPGWTDFRSHVTYQTYDVTALISKGDNAIGALLAAGWYVTPLEWLGQGNNYGVTPPALLARLRLQYADGSTEWISTDDLWKADDSPISKAEIYDGETYDANRLQVGWDKTHFSPTWNPARVIDPHNVEIEWQSFQPIRATGSITALAVTVTKGGGYIYDFGQEIAGVERISLGGHKNAEVKLRFGEVLNPDGTLYTENLRNAKATDRYILSGKREQYQPLFTFHGFRYLEVSGIPSALPLADVKAIVLHTDAPETIKLATGSNMVNKLWSNILWGQRSNFVGVPTDCPQRDERLGWSADAQVFWRTASYNADLAAFSRKYAEDLRATQVGTAMYGIYAPGTAKPNAGYGPGWSDAGVIVPWTSWLQTGDEGILNDNWDAMRSYLAAIQASNPNYLWQQNSGVAFGDWLSPEGRTSQVLIATAYWAYDVSLMKDMAHALGKSEEEKKYDGVLGLIREAFDREFLGKDGYVGLAKTISSDSPPRKNDTTLAESQTGYVLALHMNLLPLEERTKAASRLVQLLRGNGWRLGTGFLGTPYLMEVLTENGYSNVAYRLLLNEQYPSWGYMVAHGATTMWERWNGDTMRDDPSMNSYDHYAYGAVADWMYRYAAGIDTSESAPGFRKIVLRPQFDKSIKFLTLSYASRYGTIRSSWNIRGESALWSITIPPNTTGQLQLNAEQQKAYQLQGKPIQEIGSMLHRESSPQGASYTIPSGTFVFEVDLRHYPSRELPQ